MGMHISDFISERIGEVLLDMDKTDVEYAFLSEKSKALFEHIGPLISQNRDVQMDAGDCEAFREYLDLQILVNAAIERRLYRQGFADCLRMILSLPK